MNLHHAGNQADWENVAKEDRNVWQRIAARTDGIVTPGNSISVLGILLVLVGLRIMSSGALWWGLGVLLMGRIADVLDGTVADRTATKSPLGEATDAVLDKVAAVAVLIFFVRYHWTPILPMIFVALQVCSSSTLAFTARIRRVALHPTAAGKSSAVGAWAMLLIFPAATAASRSGLHTLYLILTACGYTVSVAFVLLAARAGVQYYQNATTGLKQPGRATIVCSVTGFRIVCAAVIVVLAVRHDWLAVFTLALLAFFSDFLDGWLARRWRVASTFGMTFDPLADKIVCLVLLAVVAVYVEPWYWILFAVFAFYDICTMTARFVLPRPMPATMTAKLKTAFLMLGLLAAVAGLHVSALSRVAGVILVAAAGLSLRSFVEYTRSIGRSLEWLEHTQGVTTIDFATWHERYGIQAVLFDIDGTLTPWNVKQVDGVVVSALQEAQKAGIQHIGLVSNMSPRKVERLSRVAAQVGAGTYHAPASWHEHKPSPAMIQAALTKIERSPQETAFVGDKIVDVLAARRAGLVRVAWVDRLGSEEHPLDRLFYRPIERCIKWLIA